MRHDLDQITLVGLQARDIDSTHPACSVVCGCSTFNLIPVPRLVRGHAVAAQGTSIAGPLAR